MGAIIPVTPAVVRKQWSATTPRKCSVAHMNGIFFTGTREVLTTTYGKCGTVRQGFYFPSAVRNIQFEFWNGYYDLSSGQEFDNPNPITIATTLEASPEVTRLRFENGQTYAVLQPGGRIRTNPYGSIIQSAGNCVLDTYFSVSKLGMTIPGNVAISSSSPSGVTNIGVQSTGYNGGSRTNQDATALLNYPTGNGVSSGVVFGPVMVWGEQITTTPTFAIFGDSIANGSGDNSVSWAQYYLGYIARGLGTQALYAKYTMPGSIAANAIKGGSIKCEMMTHHDFIIWEYGVNDINTGAYTTLAAMQTAYLAFWAWLASSGAKIIPCTIMPNTSSTDLWATAANQSPSEGNAAFEAIRTGYNSWLRDTSSAGAIAQSNGAILTIIDACTLMEVNASNVLTLNGGRWIANGTAQYYTTDGTHPTTNGAIFIAPSVASVISVVTL